MTTARTPSWAATPLPAPGRWVGVYTLAWSVVVALFIVQRLAALRAYDFGGAPFEIARIAATGWLIRAVIALPFFAWMRNHPIRRSRDVVQHVAAMVAFVTVENLACWGAERVLPYLKEHTIAEVFASETHLDVLTYAAMLGIVQARSYWRELRRREEEARELAAVRSRLERQIAEVRLASLSTQLQPHFLFNALHAVSSLIHTEPDKADAALEQLSELLRLIVKHDGEPEVALRSELAIVDRYLYIQQIRFGERLRVEQDVVPEALDARVPALVLQPIVENSVRHGIERRATGGRVAIRARRDGQQLRIEVEDDGPGPECGAERPGTGVGLANATERLEQLYGSTAALRLISREDGGTRVLVTIPWRSKEPTT